MIYLAFLAAIVLPAATFAQSGVVGTAPGFASGVTGGGNATPAAPADIDELTTWLTDDVPRVILIDKEFDFIGTEGTITADGCRPDSNTCVDNGGQDAINGANWCSASYPVVSVTYDNAAIKPINVAGNKSIVGVGSAGVLRGKGLRMANGAENVIIQNIHITELNPQYIWGGDAITLVGTDLIWIDHCKFSLIGRQMLVTGYEAAGRVTISNNEFDGQTSWSASCNGDHYWTMLFLGKDDQVTLSNNYIHDCSGRAPKIESSGSVTFHAVNNYFSDIGGHDFDIGTGANVLIEGNVFHNVTTPITAASASAGGKIFNVPASTDASACQSYLSRTCEVNSLLDSGDFADYTNADALAGFSGARDIVPAVAVSEVATSVVTNAGVGKLSGSTVTSQSTAANATDADSSVAASSADSTSVAILSVASSSAPASSAPASSAIVTSEASSCVATSTMTVTRSRVPSTVESSSTAPAITSIAVSSTIASSAAAAADTSAASGVIAKYYQCGGIGFTASGSCVSGTTCTVQNEYYWQCV